MGEGSDGHNLMCSNACPQMVPRLTKKWKEEAEKEKEEQKEKEIQKHRTNQNHCMAKTEVIAVIRNSGG